MKKRSQDILSIASMRQHLDDWELFETNRVKRRWPLGGNSDLRLSQRWCAKDVVNYWEWEWKWEIQIMRKIYYKARYMYVQSIHSTHADDAFSQTDTSSKIFWRLGRKQLVWCVSALRKRQTKQNKKQQPCVKCVLLCNSNNKIPSIPSLTATLCFGTVHGWSSVVMRSCKGRCHNS